MSSDYPVQFDVTSPPHFDRVQVLLRIGIAILLGWLGLTAGWLVCLLFGALPLIAAVAISSEREGRCLDERVDAASRIVHTWP